MQQPEDLAQIDALAAEFFGAFSNRRGPAQVERLYGLFIAQAVIVKNGPAGMEVLDLAGFLQPRQQLLASGRLVDFEEAERTQRTEVFGGIAQRWCTYDKRGMLDGQPYGGRGTKSLQFVRTPQGWRISAVAWEDEAG